jgi:acetyl esterase
MTNDRAATARCRGQSEDSAMDHVLGEAASADGSELDPGVRRFIRSTGEAMARQGDPSKATYPQLRAWAEVARAPWRQGGPQMLESRDFEAPTRHGPVRLRIHRPEQGELPGLVYLHGGGWTIFSLETHDRVMREYAARAGCCVIGVDYALSPEHKFPVALEQVVDVVSWLSEKGRELGIDARRLAVGGDSAGANLSVATCLVRREARSAPPLRGMLLNYGAFVSLCSDDACRRYGGTEYMLGCEEMSGYWRNYARADGDMQNPLVCPLLASMSGLPPAFLAIAECDILGEQGVQMAERLQSAGVAARRVVYAGASHSFIEAMSVSAISNQALTDASEWLSQVLRQPESGARPGGVD